MLGSDESGTTAVISMAAGLFAMWRLFDAEYTRKRDGTDGATHREESMNFGFFDPPSPRRRNWLPKGGSQTCTWGSFTEQTK